MTTDDNKKRRRNHNVSTSVRIIWLGIVNLFQTFEDLESVKDKGGDIKAVREVIDEDASAEVRSC